MKTKDRIREHALILFAKNGYAATSINDIAQSVGVKKSSIYTHISSKDALYISLLEEVLEWDRAYFSDVVESVKGSTIKEQLNTILKAYCAVYLNEPHRTKMKFLNRTMIFPPEGFEEKNKNIFKEKEILFMPLLIDILRQGKSEGSLGNFSEKDLLAFFYCTVDGLFMESSYYSREDFEHRFQSIWMLFWNAIKA